MDPDHKLRQEVHLAAKKIILSDPQQQSNF